MYKHSVYHEGELRLQQHSGVEAIADKLSKTMIMDYLDKQHEQFYVSLNMLFIASIDEYDRPWASVIAGSQGFISVPDAQHLSIDAQIIAGDILKENILHNNQIGLLGLEHHSRRRNRMAGVLVEKNNRQLLIKVKQAFGNCAKYIQARRASVSEDTQHAQNNPVKEYSKINDACRALISRADTFFIASYYPQSQHKGADISHRGGAPGFVKIEGNDTLVVNDYAGNNLYMTLGNLHSHPCAGLLFIDYDNGDLWQFQCKVEIIETPGGEYSRKMKLKIVEIKKLENALNLKWQLLES